MCGIAGCVLPPGREPDRHALSRMARALGHRGPDDEGVVVVGSVGLVHTRLSIVDPSPAGHEPMEHAGWWLTYNGEVFNHLELRERLGPRAWRGGSDTETLLHALAEWGDDAIARCNGLYAYAALDTPRRRLLLVRDRFGVKPLYVARHDGGLWFASEMRALLEAGVPRRARAGVLAHALRHGWANGPLTPLADVTRVMPGTFVSVALDTLETEERRWYDPVESVDPERMEALGRVPRAEVADALEDALRTSVRRRLMADVPVGTMCSGGLDSSLITAFAREEHPDIHAFNAAVSDQPEADESRWADQVASALGVELHTVRMDVASWRADLVDVVRHLEYPLNHESSVPMWQIAALAREDGVKVLLSGEGADELFGGYSSLHLYEHADFRARRRPHERAARWAYRRLQSAGLAPAPFAEGARGVGPLCPRSAEIAAFEADVRARALAAYGHHRGTRRRLESGLASDLSLYLPHLLNRQDKSTMKASIETRVPFLDPDVVSLALNLPLETRLEPERKGVLRDVGARHLPSEIPRRPKLGFGFHVERYLDGAVRPEFLADGHLRDLLGEARDAWAARIADANGWEALLMWSGEIWCRTLLAGDAVEAVEDALWAPAALERA